MKKGASPPAAGSGYTLQSFLPLAAAKKYFRFYPLRRIV
jgi:hypothetical protein